MIQTDELILCDIIIINFKPSLTVWKMQNDPISYRNLSDIRDILLSVRYIIVQYRLTVKFTQRQS